MKTVSVHISDELFELIETNSSVNNITKSEYLRSILSDNFNIEPEVKPSVQQKKGGMLSRLREAFGVSEEPEVENSEKRKLTIIKSNRNPDSEWVCHPRYQRRYEGKLVVIDKELKFYYRDRKVKTHPFVFNINELYLIKSAIEKDSFLVRDYRILREMLGVKQNTVETLNRVIWNVKIGYFDDFFAKFEGLLNPMRFNVKYYYLQFNGLKSTVKVSTAREILSILSNKDYSEELIFKLGKSYSEVNPVDLRVLCENWDSPNLHIVLHEKKKEFRENDPSKRRNLIRNK